MGRRNQIKCFEKLSFYLGNKIFLHVYERKAKFYCFSFLMKINPVSIMNNEKGEN